MNYLLKITFLFLGLGLVVSCSNKPAGADAKTGDAVGKAAQAAADAKVYKVSNTTSQVLWTGSKPTGQHTGTIGISNGSLSVEGNKITGGNFDLDMTSITVTDLKAEDGKGDLEGHLKGLKDDNADHFFNTRKFPTGKFVITNVEAVSGNPSATHKITGDLTLKGISKSVTFDASVGMAGNKLSAVTPAFKINRTEWGVNYKSKSVFDDLKDKFVDDDIALVINIDANM